MEIGQHISQRYNEELEDMSLQHIRFVYSVDKAYRDNVLNFMNIEIKLGYLKSNLTSDQLFKNLQHE